MNLSLLNKVNKAFMYKFRLTDMVRLFFLRKMQKRMT